MTMTAVETTIKPRDLHRYFAVREIATGREVRILGGDTRYELTGANGFWNYRISPLGDHFLAQSAVSSHPWGRPMRLGEIEPLPDGRGVYGELDGFKLARTYEGSFRQMTDQEGGR